MSEQRYLTTAAVAQALDVSVTTVKRWVDDGLLPAHRTAGGHRKILLGDVLRLVNGSDLPCAGLGALAGGHPSECSIHAGGLDRRLFEALRNADGEAVRSLLVNAYLNGWPVERLGDEAIRPALVRVGEEWAAGRMDVYQEHRATQLCLVALHELRAHLAPTADRERPLAVGGCPEGDSTLVSTFLAQLTLLEAGWNAINIGPNTPAASFGKAVRELRPRLLWLSSTHLADPERFLSEYRDLYREAEAAGTAVAVGGRALTECVRSRMAYTTFGDGLTHLAAFARSLHPRPPRPCRGRPTR